MTRSFFIWSKEHNAWWKPGRMGYTQHLDEAGAYSEDQASIICEKANVTWDGTGMPDEMMVPAAMLLKTIPGLRFHRKGRHYSKGIFG